jgi:hypothetical protein
MSEQEPKKPMNGQEKVAAIAGTVARGLVSVGITTSDVVIGYGEAIAAMLVAAAADEDDASMQEGVDLFVVAFRACVMKHRSRQTGKRPTGEAAAKVDNEMMALLLKEMRVPPGGERH